MNTSPVARPALQAIGLVKRFGGITATDNVNLSLAPGARHALIGPNGAGKTTLINLLTGVLQPTTGEVVLNGQPITHMPPHMRVRSGLVRTFQINQLFESMSAREALALAVSLASRPTSPPKTRLEAGKSPIQASKAFKEPILSVFLRKLAVCPISKPLLAIEYIAIETQLLLDQLRLSDVADRPIPQLPYGKRRLLEMGLALACKPSVLLLDEPAAGVPAGEREELLQTVADLPKDVSVLLIEHDMDLVFDFATRITVLVGGAVLTEGSPSEIAVDPRVKAVYLGQEDAHG